VRTASRTRRRLLIGTVFPSWRSTRNLGKNGLDQAHAGGPWRGAHTTARRCPSGDDPPPPCLRPRVSARAGASSRTTEVPVVTCERNAQGPPAPHDRSRTRLVTGGLRVDTTPRVPISTVDRARRCDRARRRHDCSASGLRAGRPAHARRATRTSGSTAVRPAAHRQRQAGQHPGAFSEPVLKGTRPPAR